MKLISKLENKNDNVKMIIEDDNDEEMVRETEKPFKPLSLEKKFKTHTVAMMIASTKSCFCAKWKDLLKSKWLVHTPF